MLSQWEVDLGAVVIFVAYYLAVGIWGGLLAAVLTYVFGYYLLRKQERD